MKPKLPTVPSSNLPIEALDPAWVRQLLRCVEYAMEHPKGDGYTILNSTPGLLQAVISPRSSGTSALPEKNDSGSGNNNFKLSYADGVLSCSGGFFSRNGLCEYLAVKPLAVNSLLDDCIFLETFVADGKWTVPTLKTGSFCSFYPGLFPIGEIYKGKIVQYDVKIATFIIATECPVNVRM